ncbi:MAG: UDP-N-acetylmuramoyl-L-alanyl-D-glutamate--2,6-diaminopimelate ligase, partial [Candidatus Hydrogenedentes bacterium]|nr:UDP-N-acetylmuramoyl-L-alanyl-D-glutamate--2,6-diaminopimelate ligase [Candidatus Hydrogenedentota bacterium]
MTLQDVAQLLGCSLPGQGDVAVASITEDSRRVKPGAVFVAIRGEHADGHVYAQQAVEAGAVAILGDRTDCDALHGAPYLSVPRPRKALGNLAHALAGNPSREMFVVGITGTNGKSSSVALIQKVLDTWARTGAPVASASFGTLGYLIGDETIPARHTTPFGEDLADIFRRARDAGRTHVVMEVSSHALEQDRVAGIDFDVGAFTNLTQDHLDYHRDMDDYLRAKLILFEGIGGPGRFTVVNADDPSGPAFIAASRVPCHTYGADGACRAQDVRMDASHTRFRAETPWGSADIELHLVGLHNVSNALCAIAVCGGLGVPVPLIAEGL